MLFCGTATTAWTRILALRSGLRHTATVRRVQWNPQPALTGDDGAVSLLLATVGLDNCVKVFTVTVPGAA